MHAPDEEPLPYRLQHLLRELAADPAIGETDVVLELCGDVLVVSANVPTDARRRGLVDAISAAWPGPIRDEVEVLSHLGDVDHPQP